MAFTGGQVLLGLKASEAFLLNSVHKKLMPDPSTLEKAAKIALTVILDVGATLLLAAYLGVTITLSAAAQLSGATLLGTHIPPQYLLLLMSLAFLSAGTPAFAVTVL